MFCVQIRLMNDENKTLIFETSSLEDFDTRAFIMSKPVLNFLYEALSTEKIAIITGYNSETIRKRLKKYGRMPHIKII